MATFTILYKNNSTFNGKSTDPTVYTYETAAKNEKDALRIFNMFRRTHVSVNGVRKEMVKPFTVVRIFTGDGVGTFKGFRGTERKVIVIPSKKPRWMNRNYFGKSK